MGMLRIYAYLLCVIPAQSSPLEYDGAGLSLSQDDAGVVVMLFDV